MTLTTLIAELEEAERAATPGPWLYRPNEFDDWGTLRALPEDEQDVGGFVAFARSGNNHITDDELAAHRANKTDPYYRNARLIALMRTHLPTLLEALKRQGEALENLCRCSRAIYGASPTDADALEAFEMYWEAMKEARAALTAHKEKSDD